MHWAPKPEQQNTEYSGKSHSYVWSEIASSALCGIGFFGLYNKFGLMWKLLKNTIAANVYNSDRKAALQHNREAKPTQKLYSRFTIVISFPLQQPGADATVHHLRR